MHAVATAGGPSMRTTWWGDAHIRVLGWADAHRVHVASSVREPLRHRTWARTVPLDGGPAQRLPYGPVTALDIAAGGGGVLGTGFGGRRRDPEMWKRYRGGTAGRLWIDPDATGGFVRLLPELDGQLTAPMWIGGQVAFLSDHEGVGNVYSALPDGSDVGIPIMTAITRGTHRGPGARRQASGRGRGRLHRAGERGGSAGQRAVGDPRRRSGAHPGS